MIDHEITALKKEDFEFLCLVNKGFEKLSDIRVEMEKKGYFHEAAWTSKKIAFFKCRGLIGTSKAGRQLSTWLTNLGKTYVKFYLKTKEEKNEKERIH